MAAVTIRPGSAKMVESRTDARDKWVLTMVATDGIKWEMRAGFSYEHEADLLIATLDRRGCIESQFWMKSFERVV